MPLKLDKLKKLLQDDSSYIIGTIGYEDVDCDYIGGYTYVRAQSPGLDRTLKEELAAFSNDLRRNSGTDRGTGQVSLEFYQRKKRWLVQAEDIPWEVWTVRCELVHLGNEHERLRLQEKVGEMLSEKVLFISEEMNKHGFVPKMPSQADLELIFDTSYQDVQPYLFKISHATSMPTSPSMGTAVRRLIRDTLTLS